MSTEPHRAAPHPGGPMAVEEYLQLEKSTFNARYEYLDGVARLMSGGSGEHDQISRNTANAIEAHFQSGPCFVRGSDMQVFLGHKPNGKEHYVYPDVSVSCDVADRRRGTTLLRSPRVVVEVLSPSTEKFDRGNKLEAYKACPTIQEIMLINQFTQSVDVYRRSEQDTASWSRISYGPDVEIELKSVDVCISMREIYKGIDFDEPLMEE
ncbi:MAG: Uma2 family endonuclease [Chloroflexota bacterium]|nr:Uma2 family endonuclease [Chloroflexota bacterium]